MVRGWGRAEGGGREGKSAGRPPGARRCLPNALRDRARRPPPAPPRPRPQPARRAPLLPSPPSPSHLLVRPGQDEDGAVVAAGRADAPRIHHAPGKGRRRGGRVRPAGQPQLVYQGDRHLETGCRAGPPPTRRGGKGRAGGRNVAQHALHRVRTGRGQHPVGVAHPGPVRPGGRGGRPAARHRVGGRVGEGAGRPAALGRGRAGQVGPKGRDPAGGRVRGGGGGGRGIVAFHAGRGIAGHGGDGQEEEEEGEEEEGGRAAGRHRGAQVRRWAGQ